MNCLTLFAGAGGADLGLARAGFQHIACVEGDKTACATLRAAGFPAVHAWIGGPGPDGQPAFEAPSGPVDLLWASPPCQPHSRAGKRLGAADSREAWPATLETIQAVKPTWAIIENVRGAPADAWASDLRKIGYTVSWALLDAADWGLPSHRRRVFVVAGPVEYPWPKPTHAEGNPLPPLKPWVGFGEALGLTVQASQDRGAGMTARHGERRAYGPEEPIGSIRGGGGRGGYVLTPANGGNLPAPRPDHRPAHTIIASCPQYLSRPSATVTCQEVKGTRASAASGYEFHGGPDRASDSAFLAVGRRRLTVDECRILVGFPENYPFQGSTEARYRQIGNAVAPVMGEVLGKNIHELT